MISREIQILTKLERLNSGKDLAIFDTYEFKVQNFDNGTFEIITFLKADGIWVITPSSN